MSTPKGKFGARLRHARKRVGLTRTELAQYLDQNGVQCDFVDVRAWERNVQFCPQWNRALPLLEDKFGRPQEWFLGEGTVEWVE